MKMMDELKIFFFFDNIREQQLDLIGRMMLIKTIVVVMSHFFAINNWKSIFIFSIYASEPAIQMRFIACHPIGKYSMDRNEKGNR